jgi:uncharacterized protein
LRLADDAGLIVADAGPLVALAVVNLLELTALVFGSLLAPQAVIDECTAHADAPGTQNICTALAQGVIRAVPNEQLQELDAAYSLGLGGGEVSVLAFAKLHGCVALVDEKRARRVARDLQVRVIGSGAVLVELKRRKHIKSVRPVLDGWGAHGYYLSESVIQTILDRAGELL